VGKNVFALLPRQAVSIVRRDVQCVKWITVDFDHMCVPVAHSGEWTDPAVPEAASRPIYRRVNATEVSAFPEYCPDPKPIKRRTRFLVQFLKMWRLKETRSPVPPSNTARKNQPVIELATVVSERAGIPLCACCVSKVKGTAQLKDVFEREK